VEDWWHTTSPWRRAHDDVHRQQGVTDRYDLSAGGVRHDTAVEHRSSALLIFSIWGGLQDSTASRTEGPSPGEKLNCRTPRRTGRYAARVRFRWRARLDAAAPPRSGGEIDRFRLRGIHHGGDLADVRFGERRGSAVGGAATTSAVSGIACGT
jgi:hypothetical protein